MKRILIVNFFFRKCMLLMACVGCFFLSTTLFGATNNNGDNNSSCDLDIYINNCNVTCFGAMDGSVNVNVSNGVEPYTYTWSMPGIPLDEDHPKTLPPGTYYVTITDAEGCTAMAEEVVYGPPELIVDLIPTNATCGNNDGSISVEVSGGDNPYDYLWSNGSTESSLSNLAPGTYSLTLTDSDPCSQVREITITDGCTPCEADAGTLTLISSSPVCFENGSATFSAAPNGDMLVPSGYDVLYVLTSGADLVIVDAGAQPEFTVNEEGAYTIHTLVYDATTLDLSVIDFGTTTGVDVLNLIQSQDICASLDVPGALVMVITCNPCEADAGTLTLSGNSPLCLENGSSNFSATPNGDMVVPSGYEVLYVLTTGGDLVIVGAGPQPEFIVNNEGAYTIHTLVYDPTSLDIGIVVFGTTTGVDVLNFVQSQGICASLDVAGAPITIEECGCIIPVLESVLVIEPNCNESNGSAVVSVVGNESDFSYTWTPDVSSTNIATGLAAGVYNVIIQDKNDPDCPQIEETFTVANRDGPDVEIVGTNPATCNESNGTASVLPFGLEYLWCNGSTGNSVINLPAGECYVTVTDPVSGCVDVFEVVIDEVNPLIVSASINNIPECGVANGSVTINVSNGSNNYSYVWDDGTTGDTRDNLAAGVYTVEVTDNGSTGCMQSFTFTLTNEVDGGALVSFDTPVMTTCVGSSDATIDYTIDFEPGFVQPAAIRLVNTLGVEQTNGQLSGGTYCIEVKDGNGCFVANACLEVTEPSQIDVDIALTNFDCFNFGKITLTDVSGGNGGYVYNWGDLSGNDNPRNRTDLIPGLYDLTVTDMNGCSLVANDLAIIEIEDCCINPPVIASLLVYEANCGESNGSAEFDMVGNEEDFNYVWSPPVASDQEATLVPAGDYIVTISDINDPTCLIVHRFTLGTKDGPEANVETTLATCDLPNGSATLTPTTFTYEWFDGATTNFRDDLATGYYGVIVSDPDQPDCEDFITVFIDFENPLDATAIVNQKPDCGESNGSVTLVPDGGSGSYSYSWGDATQNDLSSGSYFITITDLEWGCKTVIDFVLTDDVPGADIIPTISNVLCIGESNGSVIYELANIDPAFAFPEMVTLVNSSGQILSSNDNLAAGMYCLRLKDANGCIAGGACFDINEPSQLDVDVADAPQTCDAGGSISLAISGATGPYTVDWTDIAGSDNGPNRVDLSEGSYTAVVTDVNGCSLTVSNVVIEKDCPCEPPIITSVVLIETECGMSNGRATVNMAGGPAAYIFTWEDNVSSTHQAFNLSEGTYKVTITDPADPEVCTIEETFTVGNIGGPIFGLTTVPSSCNAADGQAVFSPNGFTYKWSDTGEETSFRLDLGEGMYQVTITDPMNPTCVDVQTVVIESDNSLDLSVTTTREPDCDSADGSVTINTGDPMGTYTYSWGIDATRTDLAAGTYTVMVRNEETGCEDEITFTLNNNVPTANITVISLPSISCPGADDGTLDYIIDVTGVVGVTQARIVDGGGNIYTNGTLAPGDYCLVIIDENDCVAGNNCFTVTPPTQIDVDIAITDETCTDMGNITLVSVTGGNGGYTYAWGDGPTTKDRTGLTAQDYDLTVLDITGCPVSETLTIDDSTYILQVLLTPTNVSCDGMGDGSITSIVNGGVLDYSYSWNNTSTDPDLMELDSGIYNVVVTDLNGCTGSATTAVIEPPMINLELPADTTICGGAILISAEANVDLTYSWTNITTGQSMGTNSAVLAQPDSFSVLQVNVIDSFGCTDEQTITVTNGTLDVQLTGPSITCDGADLNLEAINLNPSQILTYDWGPSEFIVDGVNTSNPTVMISDPGTVQFVANISNQFGCMMTDSVGITAIDTSDTPDILVHWMCEERTVNYSIVGGLGNVYTLNFGDPENPDSTTTALESTYTYPATGTYNVSLTIPGLEACFMPLMKEIDVLEPPFITADYGSNTEECADSAVIVLTDQSSSAFGPITNWEWNFSNNTSASGTNPTVILYESQTLGIELIVTNEFGCIDTINNEIDVAVVTLNPPDTVMACPSTPVALNPNAADGLVYEWTPSTYLDNPNSANPFATAPGGTNILYTVMARDSSDICMKEEQVELMVTPDMTNVSFPEDTYTCEEQQVVLNASSEEAVVVRWFDEDNVFVSNDSLVANSGDPGTTTTYTVELEDVDGCVVTEDIVIANANVTAEFESTDEVICMGDETMIQSVGFPLQIDGSEVSYSWTPTSSIVSVGADSSEIFVQPTETTMYEVEISNNFGCTSSTEVLVNVTDLSKVVLATADPDTIFDGQFTNLHATENISYTYSWTGDNLASTDTDSPQASPSTDSDYEVMVTDETGCTAEATVRVTVLNPDCDEPFIFFPNAFTPNGDGANDILYLRAPFAVTEAYFVIYSRWGEKMFESNSINDGWDGTYKGRLCNDVFGYYLRVICEGGIEYTKKGNVTILK